MNILFFQIYAVIPSTDDKIYTNIRYLSMQQYNFAENIMNFDSLFNKDGNIEPLRFYDIYFPNDKKA